MDQLVLLMALADFFAAQLFQGVFFILRWPTAMYFLLRNSSL